MHHLKYHHNRSHVRLCKTIAGQTCNLMTFKPPYAAAVLLSYEVCLCLLWALGIPPALPLLLGMLLLKVLLLQMPQRLLGVILALLAITAQNITTTPTATTTLTGYSSGSRTANLTNTGKCCTPSRRALHL